MTTIPSHVRDTIDDLYVKLSDAHGVVGRIEQAIASVRLAYGLETPGSVAQDGVDGPRPTVGDAALPNRGEAFHAAAARAKRPGNVIVGLTQAQIEAALLAAPPVGFTCAEIVRHHLPGLSARDERIAMARVHTTLDEMVSDGVVVKDDRYFRRAAIAA